MGQKKGYDIVIVGCGIFGISSALTLNDRGYTVAILNPDTIPHSLASSTDISKAVRMEYGSDSLYFSMAEESIKIWKSWNALFGETLYHEVGFLMLCHESLDSAAQSFERNSYRQLQANGYDAEIIDKQSLQKLFPAINNEYFSSAIFNKIGGYAKSGRAVEVLTNYAKTKGVDVLDYHDVSRVIVDKGRAIGVAIQGKESVFGDHILIAAGAHSPILVSDLLPHIKTTGHCLYWLRPDEPQSYQAPRLPVYTADISNSGWYGFPLDDQHGVVKLGLHSDGIAIHAKNDDRIVHDADIAHMRSFLPNCFPNLVDAPLTYTRRCLYTDTMDGHYWIDHHPNIEGLSVATGGCGHGLKMGPVLGYVIADMIERKENKYLSRFSWRDLTNISDQKEEARFMNQD